MNANTTTIARLAQTIGNGAAYGFWISSALVLVGLVLSFFLYDSSAALVLGQLFAAVGVLMVLSIFGVWACTKILARESAR